MNEDSKSLEKEFIIAQFEQSIDSFRNGFISLAQLITVFVLADVTLAGYAITEKISGIIFVGIVFPFATMHSAKVVSKLLIPPIFTAYRIEQKYGGKENIWLMSSGIRINLRNYVASKLNDICSIDDVEEQTKQLQQLTLPLFGPITNLVNAFLFTIAIAHIVVPLLLTYFFGWRLL